MPCLYKLFFGFIPLIKESKGGAHVHNLDNFRSRGIHHIYPGMFVGIENIREIVYAVHCIGTVVRIPIDCYFSVGKASPRSSHASVQSSRFKVQSSNSNFTAKTQRRKGIMSYKL